jgi:GDP-mannose 6-dehydrogenase
MKISVFGFGYVGVVSGACLAKLGHEVIGVDISEAKVAMVNDGISPIVEEGIAELTREVVEAGRLRATTDAAEAIAATEVSLISVGTPSAANGALSMDAIRAVTHDIGRRLRDKEGSHTLIFRSTVLPGTTEEVIIPILVEQSNKLLGDGFDVCFNPEFLREGSSIRDFENPPYTVVGSATERGFAVMEEIYRVIDAPFVRTGYRVAESVKYLSNLYHAVKISFANEVGAVLGGLGIDSREAASIFCMDTVLNVSKAYLRPGYAFGGSCLPKDMRAFLSLARARDIELPMLSNLLVSNQRHVERAFDMVAANGRRRVALLGLSFKPGTDDLRESPFVSLAEKLIGKGYELAIYDPNVVSARLIGANKDFIDREIPHLDRLLGADIATTLKDAEMVVIGHVGKDDIAALLALDENIPIVDLQGVAELEAAERPGYRGICW